jgi:hypothetical protein
MARVIGMDGMQWAAEITKAVQQAGGMTSLWAGGPGSVPGTVAWSSLVDSFASLEQMGDALLGSADYVSLLAQAGQHVASIEPDVMMEIVHGAITGQAELGSYIGAVNATVNPDRGPEALAWAVQIADAWAETTGVPVVVVTNAAGPMGGVGWLARHADAASIDASNAKIAGSASFAEVYGAGAGLFTDGHQMYARRVA